MYENISTTNNYPLSLSFTLKNISKPGFYKQSKKFTLKRGKRDQAKVHYSECKKI